MFKLSTTQVCVTALVALTLFTSAPANADSSKIINNKAIVDGHLLDILTNDANAPRPNPSAPQGTADLVPGLSVTVLIGQTDNPLADGVVNLGPLNATTLSAAGCVFPWTYYVKNNGIAPTNAAFHASLIVMKTVNGQQRTVKVETESLKPLDGGHATPVSGTLVLPAGQFVLDVLVDRGDKVVETDETNNRNGRMVHVASGCGNG